MGSYSDVVEISSEEEDAGDNNFGMKTHLNGSGNPLEPWDDLFIMDELSAPPVLVPKKTVVPTTLSISDDDRNYDASADGGGGDDDDDCQVLDSDPDKSVVAVNGDKDDESDEIEIVGAKGEVLLIFLNFSLIIVCLSACLVSCKICYVLLYSFSHKKLKCVIYGKITGVKFEA